VEVPKEATKLESFNLFTTIYHLRKFNTMLLSESRSAQLMLEQLVFMRKAENKKPTLLFKNIGHPLTQMTFSLSGHGVLLRAYGETVFSTTPFLIL